MSTRKPHRNVKKSGTGNVPAVRRKRRTKRKVNTRNLWTVIFVICISLEIIVASIGMYLLHGMLETKPELNVDDFFSAESSHIYDKDGRQIADFGTQIRENVSYNEMSESLIDAFVAVEDSRYFKHDGFDLPRFTKSALVNVKNILTHNSSRQGGSTFTMQLVKLTYFQNDEAGTSRTKDIEYKVQQIVLARELEQKSNKKAIYEMYLNKMNFGGSGNIRGIEKAAQYYYGKHAGELNLPEAAMLAGVINSPYYYDPHNFLDYATDRRNTVLYQMLNHGYITKEEYRLAKSVKVEDTLIDPNSSRGSHGGEKYQYQSYIDTVINEAAKITGQDPYSVAMDIYTFMDPNVQAVMDDIQEGNYSDRVVFPDELMEVGMISENNQTGEIVAIGGGRNYGRGGSMLLNHATSQYKQPGSSVKPFLDYALAFEYLGWATSHVVTDKPITYQGTNMVIKNANGQYNGEVTLSYAIAASLNTPAIQCFQEVINTAGWQTVADYIKSLNFSHVDAEAFDVGFAIGGSNFTVSAKELMAAHAVIMNGGYYIEPHTISKIVFRSGAQEPLTPTYTPAAVLSAQAAWLTSRLMYYAIHGGVYNYLQILDRGYATYGKTGTTDWGSEGLQYNIPQGASKDKWMVSETSQYTTVVWVGYEKGVKDANTYFDSEKSNLNIPGNISSIILDALHADSTPQEVAKPDGISTITHILGTFPYASPASDMDSSMITSGYIKSQYATLVNPQSAEIESMASFDAKVDDNNNVTLNWSVYPDRSKLETADGTMDISLYDSAGNILVQAYGKRLFDWSWVYGPLRYKAHIRQNGTLVKEVTSASDTWSEEVDLAAGTTTEACGFYAYESGAGASNEICITFTTKEKKKDPEPTPEPEPTPDPAEECQNSGGTWNGSECVYPTPEPEQPEDNQNTENGETTG